MFACQFKCSASAAMIFLYEVLTKSALKIRQMYKSTFKCEKTRLAFILWKCRWEHAQKCTPHTSHLILKNNVFCFTQKHVLLVMGQFVL